MDDDIPARLAAEQRARVIIDAQLVAAGWQVQDRAQMNLYAGQGVAVRESIMKPGHGRADYLLYVDKRAVGVIEAKPEGDGPRLAELMLRHGVGVQAETTVTLHQLDEDFFEAL